MMTAIRKTMPFLLAAAAILGGGLWLARATVEAQPRGKAVYDAHCVECHGATGKGLRTHQLQRHGRGEVGEERQALFRAPRGAVSDNFPVAPSSCFGREKVGVEEVGPRGSRPACAPEARAPTCKH